MGFTLKGHLLELTAPATKLAIEVPLPSSQIAETNLVRVHLVKTGQGAGDVWANRRSDPFAAFRHCLGVISQEVAFDKFHDVEGPFIDGFVFADPKGGGNGLVRSLER